MGAITFNRNVRYYRFKDGKIIHKSQSGEITYYDALTGKIKLIEITNETFEGENYQQVIVNLYDGVENSLLAMRFGSGYCNAFCKLLPNVDFSKDIEISGKSEVPKEGGHARTSVFIRQDNKAVKWYFTKNNPNGLPSGEKYIDRKTKQEAWDFTEQNDFLMNLLIEADYILRNAPQELFDKLPRRIFNTVPVEKPIVLASELNGNNIADDLPF